MLLKINIMTQNETAHEQHNPLVACSFEDERGVGKYDPGSATGFRLVLLS